MYEKVWLHWSPRKNDLVHRASKTTLTELATTAKSLGLRWSLSYPEGKKAGWAWFEVQTPSGPKKKRSRKGKR